jgi:hypothetical protein
LFSLFAKLLANGDPAGITTGLVGDCEAADEGEKAKGARPWLLAASGVLCGLSYSEKSQAARALLSLLEGGAGEPISPSSISRPSAPRVFSVHLRAQGRAGG